MSLRLRLLVYFFYDVNLYIVLSCFPQIDAELEYEGQ